MKDWWLFGLFLGIILAMGILVIESVVYMHYDRIVMMLLLLGLTSLMVFSVFLYYKINKEYEKQIALAKEMTKHDYMHKNFQRINYLYDYTMKEKHRMTYVLLKIQNLISQGKNIEAAVELEKQIKEIDSLSAYQSYNPYFDYNLQEKIYSLHNKGINVQTVLELKKVDILADELLVSDLMQIMDLLAKHVDDKKTLSNHIQEIPMYVVVKFSASSHSPLKEHYQYKSSFIKRDKVGFTGTTITYHLWFKSCFL